MLKGRWMRMLWGRCEMKSVFSDCPFSLSMFSHLLAHMKDCIMCEVTISHGAKEARRFRSRGSYTTSGVCSLITGS
jgi:hypothetical protein